MPSDAATPTKLETSKQKPKGLFREFFWGKAFTIDQTNKVSTDPSANLNLNDQQRRHFLLILLILGEALIILVALPFSITVGQADLKNLIIFGLGLLTLLICYYLTRSGYIELAGYIFLLMQDFLLVGRNFFVEFPILAELFGFFALGGVIVAAGLVIDEYAPWVITILGIGSYLGAFLLKNRLEGITPADQGLVLNAIFFGTSLNLILAALAWGNARTVRRLLYNLARQNEQLLNFNHQMARNLQTNLVAGNSIAGLATELTHISHQQTERAENQVQSVAIVSTTLLELSSTARQIAEVAQNVFTATEQALKTAEQGGQAVGKGINGIESLQKNVESIVEIVSDLDIQSKRISEIVQLITELAEETNLLALNATIEAAGAGEYGRRFAVVAAEVQDLSVRSRASAHDIQQILRQIQKAITNSLTATGRGLEESQRLNQVAVQAGASIEQMIKTVKGTTQLARQIHLTTQQQKSATDQAVEMVRQVASDARDAAGGAQHILEASHQLGQTATTLRSED